MFQSSYQPARHVIELIPSTTLVLYDQCGIFQGVLTTDDFVQYEGETMTAILPQTVTDGMLNWTTGMLTINVDGATRQVKLDAEPPALLDKYNALLSSTGVTDVRYVADTKSYIDNALAAIASNVSNE